MWGRREDGMTPASDPKPFTEVARLEKGLLRPRGRRAALLILPE